MLLLCTLLQGARMPRVIAVYSVAGCENATCYCCVLCCRVRECHVLLLCNRTKGCFVPAPYLDDYGETDQGLR